jgi:hypothetical protein
MSNIFVSFMFAFGIAGWFYFKIMHRTGGVNSKSAFVLVSLIAFVAFLAMVMLLEVLSR